MRDASAGPAPACEGPDPTPHGPTLFRVPPGAVDTHAHVIGLPPSYPLIADRRYTPPAATPEAYLSMLDAAGMAFGVLVQVSVHGIDNRLMVETLTAHRARLRGIAVVSPEIGEPELTALKESGIVGLRLNVAYGGGIGLDHLERYGAICRDFGWHVQLLIQGTTLPDLAPRLARLSVPMVFDHMGHIPASRGLDDPGCRMLLSLVADGAWVKLSGAYRVSGEGIPYRDTILFARKLVETAPERCVWGSDWPHLAIGKPMMNVGDLLDVLADWAPDDSDRRHILVDNPHRLYGF